MSKARNLPLELKALLLREPRLTLAVAESLTCGNLQALIGLVSGASEYFLGGVTAYTLEQKVRHLGVDRVEAKATNCVSVSVAEQMALGACRLFGSELGLATTGYAEPSAAQGVAEPFAFWALAYVRPRKKPVLAGGRVECVGARRNEAQRWIAAAALGELVVWLAANRT